MPINTFLRRHQAHARILAYIPDPQPHPPQDDISMPHNKHNTNDRLDAEIYAP